MFRFLSLSTISDSHKCAALVITGGLIHSRQPGTDEGGADSSPSQTLSQNQKSQPGKAPECCRKISIEPMADHVKHVWNIDFQFAREAAAYPAQRTISEVCIRNALLDASKHSFKRRPCSLLLNGQLALGQSYGEW